MLELENLVFIYVYRIKYVNGDRKRSIVADRFKFMWLDEEIIEQKEIVAKDQCGKKRKKKSFY